jgi:O-antigen ligase
VVRIFKGDIAITLFCLGALLPAMSFSNYLEIPAERTIFKAFGSIAILISTWILFQTRKISFQQLGFTGCALAMVPHALMALSAFFWDFSGSLPLVLRAIVGFAIITFLINLNRIEIILVLRIFIVCGLAFSVIAILEMALGLSDAEKLPVLNWRTSKSIIFEQNVFGIYVYLCLLAHLSVDGGRKNLLYVVLLIGGVLASYYRSVYALLMLRGVIRFPVAALSVLIFIGASSLSLEQASEILKADQFSSLTGRDTLWRIGLNVFYESPLLGSSELSIPSISNEILNRTPPYTTYHNVLIDLASSGGLIAVLGYLMFGLYCVSRAVGYAKLTVLFIYAPALFNTFIPFAPNMLGALSGALLVILCRLYKRTESTPELPGGAPT